MWVSTAHDSAAPCGSVAVLTVYGDRGRSRDVALRDDGGGFEPGTTDEFDEVRTTYDFVQERKTHAARRSFLEHRSRSVTEGHSVEIGTISADQTAIGLQFEMSETRLP